MSKKPTSIEGLRSFINKGEAKDPLIFLESIMNGQDPRNLSEIYELIMEIDDFTNGNIDPSDWSNILDLIRSSYKYKTTNLSESINASKTLAEYLYPKRQSISLTGSDVGSESLASKPLTEEEVEVFKEIFNDEF